MICKIFKYLCINNMNVKLHFHARIDTRLCHKLFKFDESGIESKILKEKFAEN